MCFLSFSSKTIFLFFETNDSLCQDTFNTNMCRLVSESKGDKTLFEYRLKVKLVTYNFENCNFRFWKYKEAL